MPAPHSRPGPTKLLVGAAAIFAVTLASLQSPADQEASATLARSHPVQVIVQATDSHAAALAVATAGGHVTRVLGIVDGVAADVPSTGLAVLARSPGVRAVTPDARMHVQSNPQQSGRSGTRPSGSLPNAAAPPLPASVYGAEVRAPRSRSSGARGQGVTVALLDTGVTASPDLAGRIRRVTDDLTGKTSQCENLSGEPNCKDTYGHGTFMAGLIAGNGASSDGRYPGIAPRAKLVSIKVGSRDGSADVSNVLAGVQWAVSFKDRYDISVLNLSLGTDSTADWHQDPLNYAVERAWDAGITVIVSASNRGPDAGTISKPADDPWVITVGAVDDRLSPAVGDDVLPDFSGRGPAPHGVAKPDLVAPGAHLVSLRSVGSTIDKQFPTYVAGAYHQGSGTSMATAVVSGVAALVLSAHPEMSPNRLKFSLTSTARAASMTVVTAVGAGVVDSYAALNAPAGDANADLARSNGLGSLDASRGTVTVQTQDPLHTVLDATLTAQLVVWDPLGVLLGIWTPTTWIATPWYTAPWYSTRWYGSTWPGHNWEGCSDDGGHEDGCTYGHNWEGSTWYGAWG